MIRTAEGTTRPDLRFCNTRNFTARLTHGKCRRLAIVCIPGSSLCPLPTSTSRHVSPSA